MFELWEFFNFWSLLSVLLEVFPFRGKSIWLICSWEILEIPKYRVEFSERCIYWEPIRLLGRPYNLMQNPSLAVCWGARWASAFADPFWLMASLERNIDQGSETHEEFHCADLLYKRWSCLCLSLSGAHTLCQWDCWWGVSHRRYLAPTGSAVVAFCQIWFRCRGIRHGGRLHRVHLSEGQAVELRAFFFASMHVLFSSKYLEGQSEGFPWKCSYSLGFLLCSEFYIFHGH